MEKNMNIAGEIIAVIPTHGAGEAFIECIESLLCQTLRITEIIIIDNNVKDGSIDKIKSLYKISQNSGIINGTVISIYNLSENTGVTGGRNKGIEKLPDVYDYVIFVDHDMICEKSLVQELCATAQRNKECGIVTPKVYYFEKKDIIWSAGTDIDMVTGQTIFFGGEDKGQYELEKEVSVAPAILLVKKDCLQAVKKFDQIYFATYEDTDFCFAAKKKGFSTFYSPKAIAYHKIPYNQTQAMMRLIDRLYYVARNRIIFMRRYAPNFSRFVIFLPFFGIYYLFLCIKYAKLKNYWDYLRGSIDGFLVKT